MTEFHSIRLHGSWNAEVIECFDSASSEFDSEQRIEIPSNWGDWLGPAFRGRVAYHRTFHLPTRLESDQPVWLVVEEVDFRGSVFLNDGPIGALQLGDSPLRVEVRQQLLESNRLRIEVELTGDEERGGRASLGGGLIGAIRLEIQESAGR